MLLGSLWLAKHWVAWQGRYATRITAALVQGLALALAGWASEPLLLLPIAAGCMLANLPLSPLMGDAGIVSLAALTTPVLLAQALHQQVTARGGQGAVVNLLDQKLWNQNPDFVSYTLSKAALHTATSMLAQALAGCAADLADLDGLHVVIGHPHQFGAHGGASRGLHVTAVGGSAGELRRVRDHVVPVCRVDPLPPLNQSEQDFRSGAHAVRLAHVGGQQQ